MSEESKRQGYKYSIPRNVKTRFTLFGLNRVQLLLMVPVLGVAWLLLKVLSGPPKILFPVVLVGIVWVAMTQEIDGETPYEYFVNRIKDGFRTKTIYWEEVNHDRYYQKFVSDQEESEEPNT